MAADAIFPRADTALRRGRHVDADEPDLYGFLSDAQALLEPFYRRFDCDLVRSPNGYFYLLPSDGGLVARRQMTAGAMLAGQALALLYLDPATLQSAGVVSRAQVLELLASLVGEERLLGALNPRRRRRAEQIDQERVRQELDRGLRLLASLGFVDLVDGDGIRLRTPLLRFTDVVRGLENPAEALARLVARGEVELREAAEDEDDEA